VLKLPLTDHSRGLGPQVPGAGDTVAVSGQDDIDALLASVADGPR
jgi:chemotaxis regulatin CheY-phosphate phosphatase CheZ